MWTIPKNLSSNQNDFHVNMIKTNVNLYIISHKIMIKYWQNAIGSIQISIFFINTAKMTISSKLHMMRPQNQA